MMNAKESSSSGAKIPASNGSSASVKHLKKPKYSRFTQQELPACKPILTPARVIATFLFVAVVFIPIGVAALLASEKVVEIVYRYDTECIPKQLQNDTLAYIQDSDTNKTCTANLNVPHHMKSPIYIYYQLDNFYQNHRRYVQSRNDKQLKSKAGENYKLKTCYPEGKAPGRSTIVPCGLIAWSLFNDTYKFSVGGHLGSKNLEVSKKDIAWKSDVEHKFGKDVYPKNFQAGGVIGGAKLNASIPLSEQTDLIVWMRTAALPTFRKIYGKIENDLEPNETITVVIENNYNTYSFGGRKKLVLSTTSWMGGKNNSLGIAYLAVGGMCFLFAVGFIVLHLTKPRTLGDPSYLSWNKTPAGYAN